jgi:CO/xanthine dehydrogenase FAD-binding subunit
VPDYDYHRATTLDGACRLLEELPGAQILAGGTDLVVDVDTGIRQAEHLVSVRDIPELRQIELQEHRLSIGAGCTATEVERSDLIREHLPELAEMVVKFASPQIRNRATLAGNICSAVACGDFPPVLMALGGSVELLSRAGRREVLLEDFFVGNRQTVRKESELITRIFVALKPDGAAADYQKFRRRAANSLGVASVAVYLELKDGICRAARIVLGAVAPTPMLATRASKFLEGGPVDASAIEKAADLAREEARPINDLRATAEYRRDLVQVLTMRAIRSAQHKINGKP